VRALLRESARDLLKRFQFKAVQVSVWARCRRLAPRSPPSLRFRRRAPGHSARIRRRVSRSRLSSVAGVRTTSGESRVRSTNVGMARCHGRRRPLAATCDPRPGTTPSR
jgi:hypothetical protein